MKIKYFLKEPNQSNETMVYISLSIGGKRLKRSTGVKVKSKNWTGERVKNLAPNSANSNLKLENIERLLVEIEREYLLKNQYLTKEILEKEFDERLNPIEEKPIRTSFDEVFDEFINSKRNNTAKDTIKTYNTCRKHLKSFVQEEGIELSFENIDMSFYDDFLNYFYDKEYLNSTIGKYMRLLKTFMNWAMERNYHQNVSFRNFYVFKNDSEKVKLNFEIVEKLRKTEFSKEDNLVRDAFILSCYTGLRYSDIAGLKQENIFNNEIKVLVKKTKDIITIPLLDVPKEILERHMKLYNRIRIPTNQHCNRVIKQLFREVGFLDKIEIVKWSGNNKVVRQEESCKFITMHYGRAFFITNSLVNGMNEELIREITGHRDYKSFKKYVHIPKDALADSLRQAWK